MSEQIEIPLDLNTGPPPLPEILSLEEFLDQIEREYGGKGLFPAIRAALRPREDHE